MRRLTKYQDEFCPRRASHRISGKKKVAVFAGTISEAIKVAPVVSLLQAHPDCFEVSLCSIEQHREMLTQTFADFGLTPDISFDVMAPSQGLSALSSMLFHQVGGFLATYRPDIVLVQGDTTTVQVTSLTAFYASIPVGHIEAGLRSWDIANPFPEELNHRIVGLVSRWHFAPTELARNNLLQDKVPEDRITVTGNTMVDALLLTLKAVSQNPPPLPTRVEEAIAQKRDIILVTGHRRENFGQGIRNICQALSLIANVQPEARIIYPVHLDPNVRGPVFELLRNAPNVYLEAPLPHKALVRLMAASKLILSDSGGIQEEGTTLGKPVLIMRNVTERPEDVECGASMLVGIGPESILRHTVRLMRDDAAYASMLSRPNPYGDGNASERIVCRLRCDMCVLRQPAEAAS
ncbi:MAG: UDP-N-acetylglucosamine 2-epimerase (non-hydrolyzing) [Desulfobulbus sp.]|nr:UDP-N-acetylglucosamine 2-epimerase (non-hydrolyzing) [Desulfobulbus sp.]